MDPSNDEEDPSHDVKPIIKELVRTEVCFPDLKLLVDKVYIANLPNRDDQTSREAFRLYLSDGEKIIQALLPRKIHDTVSSGLIREGSYVVLQRYRLARGKKRIGKGDIVYLIIEDWYTIGEDERDFRDPIPITAGPDQIGSKDTDNLASELLLSSSLSSSLEDGDVFASILDNDITQTHPQPENTPATGADIGRHHLATQLVASDAHATPAFAREMKRPAPGEALRDIDTNTSLGQNNDIKRIKRAVEKGDSTVVSPTALTGFNHWLVTKVSHASISNPEEYYKTTAQMVGTGDRRTNARTPMGTGAALQPITKAKSLALSSSAAPKIRKNLRPISSSSSRMPVSREIALPITRPLRIYPLSSILSPHNRRNSIVDVLAVITFISQHVVTPPRLPPKRDLRLLDPSCPSTRQPVLFSVFVDPDHFRPAVGTVALFRSVTTHEWNGGSLNAYDKDCGGRRWFLPDPVGVDGCDVQGLKDYYKKWLAEEQKKEAEKELLKELELEERQRQGSEARIA